MLFGILNPCIFGAAFFAAPVSPTVPPPPVPVVVPAFAAQVSGRTALCNALYQLTVTRRTAYNAVYRTVTLDDKGAIQQDATRTETVVWDRPTNSVLVVLPSSDGKSVTRFVSEGKNLLVAVLDKGRRAYSRLPLEGETRSIANALNLVDGDRIDMGGITHTALFDQLETGVFRSPALIYRQVDKSIIEQFAARDDNGHRAITVRRYRLALPPSANPIASREVWETWQDAGKPVVVRGYTSETIVPKPFSSIATPFSTKPAVGYQETPPPVTNRTFAPPSGLDDAEPRAKKLLVRWVKAWSAFTAFQAQVHVREWEVAQTKESMRPSGDDDREALMDICYMRTGKLSIYSRPTGKPNAFTRIQNVISDGKSFVVYNGANREEKRDGALSTDDPWLNDVLRDNGLHDFSEALPRIMRNPSELLGDTVETKYLGVLPIPGGGTAEAVRLTQLFGDNGPIRRAGDVGRATVQQTVTLYFDAVSGLPLRSAFERKVLLSGRPGEVLSDLPPLQYRVADYMGLKVNQEPSPLAFEKK